MISWYLAALRRYATFTGRASRKEYWYFMLATLLIHSALAGADAAIGLLNKEAGIGLLGAIYVLAMVLPGLAVTVRRFHDAGLSGWWTLLSLLPLAEGLIISGFACLPTSPRGNHYEISHSQAVELPKAPHQTIENDSRKDARIDA